MICSDPVGLLSWLDQAVIHAAHRLVFQLRYSPALQWESPLWAVDHWELLLPTTGASGCVGVPIAGSQYLVCLLALNAELHPPEVMGCCLLADRLTAGRWALRLRRASHGGPVEPPESLTAGAYSLLVTGFPTFALGCDLCVGHYLLEPVSC